MSTRKKFFLVFSFIIFDAALVIGILAIRDATSINKLKGEVNTLASMNILTDDYNTPIKTSGKYAIVEKSIKEYLNGYAVGVQDIFEIVTDEQLKNILSYSNYQADGPNFDKSLEYLASSKDDFNKRIDVLIDTTNEDNIEKYVNQNIKDDYYKALYIRLMTSDEMTASLYPTKDLLMRTKIRQNNIYDVSIEVLNYLKVYKDSWSLENNEIKFKNEDLYNHYIELISKLDNKEE